MRICCECELRSWLGEGELEGYTLALKSLGETFDACSSCPGWTRKKGIGLDE
jgi:hypothetical protein